MNSGPSSQRQLESSLAEVWKRSVRLHLSAGALAFFRWAVPIFLVAMCIDWLVRLPAGVRGGAVLGLLAYSLYKAWMAGWNAIRSFNATHTALQVEKHYGGMDSLLVTAVQHGEVGSTPGMSDAMRERACQMAGDAVKDVKPSSVVSFQILRHSFMNALMPALVLVVFAVLNGPFLGAGFGRFFTPWLEIEYPTRTQLELAEGDLIVKEGEAIRILANLSGEVPEQGKIILKTGKGKPRERTISVAENAMAYEVDSVFRSFAFQIHAGDARSSWHDVKVVSSPKIEKVEVTLSYPEYTKRPVEVVEGLNLTVPEGSELSWKLTLDRAVSKADFEPSVGESQTLEISEEGLVVSFGFEATQSKAYTFSWVGREHGFAFESPRHYLQVAPDKAPTVELAKPENHLIATLGRKVDYVYRVRDDHGIEKASLFYRLNKSEAKEVALELEDQESGSSYLANWDYREALPDLVTGDVLTVSVSVKDGYPGKEGPHVARSDGRRVQFVTKKEYLAYIEKQKRRLLTRIKSIYREERGIHEIVRSLHTTGDALTQAYQLEAVRQDLIRDRLYTIAGLIDGLLEDLAANQLAEEAQSSELGKLTDHLRDIADEQVGKAASLFRELASAGSKKDPSEAVHMVDKSARELGLLVLQLGFQDAADVMARELHATAQVQATLRLKTILKKEGTVRLPDDQTRLSQATDRLLASIPKNKESTPGDALVAFNLARIVNMLVRKGTVEKLTQSAELLEGKDYAKAAKLQADVTAAFLRAEFRLRLGSEFEALSNAHRLFTELSTEQKALQKKVEEAQEGDFAQQQDALLRKLQLLLMPEIPASRAQLFDNVPPPPPPVNDLLVSAENSIQSALAGLQSGKADDVLSHQLQASRDFETLAQIVQERMEFLAEDVRLRGMSTNASKIGGEIMILEERLLQLLEKTEDAAADEINTASFSQLSQELEADIRRLGRNIVRDTTFGAGDFALAAIFEKAGNALGQSNPFLKENEPDPAIEKQEEALEALEGATLMVEDLSGALSSYSGALQLTANALAPSPLLLEIESEQLIMLKATEKAKPEEYPSLIIPQKNLVHAVNAALDSMDPLAHKVETGTILLFAKDDMDAAAIGLQDNDIEEALDAQSFVAESLAEIRGKIDAITPQYRYIREVTEHLYRILSTSPAIQFGFTQMQNQSDAAPSPEALKQQIQQFGEALVRLTGDSRYEETAELLLKAVGGEAEDVEDAIYTLQDDTADLALLLKNLGFLIAPPADLSNIPEPTPEVKLILNTLDVASYHMGLIREAHSTSEGLEKLATRQQKLEQQAADLLPASEDHPELVAAQNSLAEAVTQLKANERDSALSSQIAAREALRHFIIEYTLEFVEVPPPPPPEDGAPSEDAEPVESDLDLLMPGALTGRRPKGGRQEWQVLGRRERAALNENFARELPLEYRSILKNYYERLTE